MWSDDGANGRKRCVCCVLQQLDRFLADNVVKRRKYQSKSPLAPTPPRPHENRQPDGSQTLGSRCRGQSATREHARPEESWQLCAGSRGQGTDRRWLLAWQLLASQLSCLRASTRSSNLATSTLATSPTSLTTPPPARMFVPRPSLHPPPRRCDPPPQVLVPRRRGGKVP